MADLRILSLMLKFKNNINTALLIAPWAISLIIFWIYPIGYSLVLSLSKYSTLKNELTYIGFGNFTKAFSDPIFWKALVNTIIFTFGSVPITIALALFLAILLNNKWLKFASFFQASYFLPSITSLVVISLVFTNLYSANGYVNEILKLIGAPFPKLGFLLEPSTALYSIMAMDIWISTGYYTILILAGLQTIPNDLYESAILVGASEWQRFKRITLPLLRPTLLFVLVINTIKSLQVFVEIFVMTKGGPLDSTTSLVYIVYQNAFEKADNMGYASALAYILFVIILAFSYVQAKTLKAKN